MTGSVNWDSFRRNCATHIVVGDICLYRLEQLVTLILIESTYLGVSLLGMNEIYTRLLKDA